MALPKNLQDREMGKFIEDASGDVALRTALVVKDIQIGAVEIKNHDTDDRVEVNASHELLTKNSALETLVGEVHATPTSNSLLARLKDLLTGIVLAAGANKIGDTGLLGNTSSDGSGTDYHLILDDSGRLHTRGFRLADGTGARMLVDADRHGQVDVLSMPSVAVTGAFYQATQPVSIATIPIAATAATSAKQLADGHNVALDKIGSGVLPVTVNVTAAGATSLLATPGAGHHLRIKAFSISSDDAADSEFELRDDVSAKFKFNIPKDGGNIVVNLIGANWDLTTNKPLTINTVGATDLHVNISYEDITD